MRDEGQGLRHGLRGGGAELQWRLPVTEGDSRTRASHQEPGLLAPGIARFTPAGVDLASLPPSLALERPWPALGPLPSGWGVAPAFMHLSGSWQAAIEVGEVEIELNIEGVRTGNSS